MMKKYFLLVFLALAALIVSCGKTPVSDPVEKEDEETATPSTPATPSEPKDYTIKSYGRALPLTVGAPHCR